MPNFCENFLQSSMPLYHYINQENEFSLDLIESMPEILNDLGSLYIIDNKNKLIRDNNILEYNKFHLASIAKKQTGFTNWYDWMKANWGCQEVTDTLSISDNLKEIWFTTPWNPPYKIIKKLADRYPLEKFILKYAEPGVGFCGIIEYVPGNYIHKVELEIDDEDAKEIMLEFYGEEFFENEE